MNVVQCTPVLASCDSCCSAMSTSILKNTAPQGVGAVFIRLAIMCRISDASNDSASMLAHCKTEFKH